MRAQAALEYLMTYGWAILIIVIAIGALYAMGLFGIGAPQTCSPCFPAGGDFTYQDHSVVNGILYLSVQEGPDPITVNNVTATITGVGSAYNDTVGTINANELKVITVDLSGLSLPTSAYSIDVQVTYTSKQGVPHTASATLHVRP